MSGRVGRGGSAACHPQNMATVQSTLARGTCPSAEQVIRVGREVAEFRSKEVSGTVVILLRAAVPVLLPNFAACHLAAYV